jgi:putative endopeptidase
MKSKSDLADQVAHIHLAVPGAWRGDDNQTRAALLGFGPQPAYDDATRVVASIDQGGLGLPNRDLLSKDDDKSKEILSKYEAHVAEMLDTWNFRRNAEQGAADAKTVVAIETALAQAQMDNVARRDPKNLNNKMSLKQVQALTPSFDWKAYLKAIKAPPSSPYYLVSSPQFFRSLEQVIQQYSVDDWKVYLRWQLIHGSAPYLYKPIADENWVFYSQHIAGSKTTAAPVAPLCADCRPRSWNGSWTGIRSRGFSAREQTARRCHGARHRERAGPGHNRC